MGTLAAVGTSNSKTATEPPDASPSSRNRIANCPIPISSLGLFDIRKSPLLGPRLALTTKTNISDVYATGKGQDRVYSPSCLEEVFSETGSFRHLGFSETCHGSNSISARVAF